MREIKFRAWDSKYKLMRLDMTYAMAFDGTVKLLSKYKDNESGQYHSCGNGIIPMQSTGLKDKNGKEIYEGDIVKYQLGRYKDPDGGYGSDNWEMFDEVAEVVYDEAKGRFKRKDRFHDFLDTPECEVIGNIYESPELLGGKNV